MAKNDRVLDLFSFSPANSRALQVADNVFNIANASDPTKQVSFSAAGVTTATERVITLPDYNVTLGTVPFRRPVLVGASVLNLTEAQSGSVIACGAAEDFVLPTLTATNLGLTYEFIVTATASSLTITAATAQILHGGVRINSTTLNEQDSFSANGSSHLVVTMNGTTQGGIVGSHIVFFGASTTQWLVSGDLIGSGTIVTVFS
jgi:hypothetical protein